MKSTDGNKASTSELHKGRLGLSVRPLSEEEKSQADASGGLMVESIGKGPAEKAGIQPGDIILAVNGTPVETIDQLRVLVDKYQKNLALLIQRGDSKLFVPVPLG